MELFEHSFATVIRELYEELGIQCFIQRALWYAENFFTFPDRITADEWVDILQVGLPGSMAKVAVNPGENPLPVENAESSCAHSDAQPDVCNESPQYLDIIGDEREELIAFSQG